MSRLCLSVFILSLLATLGCATASPDKGQCGDGVPEFAEDCDDGNLIPADGCNEVCKVEVGFVCGEEPSVCGPICGDGMRMPNERCDGIDLGDNSCDSLGLGNGQLACRDTCEFNTSNCQSITCGNNILDPTEECDAAQLDGETCQSKGFDEGTLRCTDCTVDTTECIRFSCGNGVIDGEDECDDENVASGDGCSGNCSAETGWLCTGEPSTCVRQCGDGNVTGVEECDGDNLNGASCETVGNYVGGNLLCQGSCEFNETECTPIVCGDGLISSGEQCDDDGANGGDGCSATCQIEAGWLCSGEPSMCEFACGNGMVDSGEDCEGANLNGRSCLSEGFPGGGQLGCTVCSFNYGDCVDNLCPNGIKEPTEDCDGTDFGALSCSDFGFAGGSLTCSGTCKVGSGNCANSVCGNNLVEAGEQCDDNNNNSGDGCSSTCQWENSCSADEVTSCPSGQSDSTSGDSVSGYSCGGGGGSADHIYQYTVPANRTSLTVTLTCDDGGFDDEDDYDLYILRGGCHPNLCTFKEDELGCGTSTISVTPGETYYIVVEDFGSFGDFTIDISCS